MSAARKIVCLIPAVIHLGAIPLINKSLLHGNQCADRC